jgi:energy-coupling factor transport system substrate-specific component
MDPRWARFIAAAVAFLVVTAVGVVLAGGIQQPGEADPITFAYQAVANVLALILAVTMIVAIVTYLAVEWIQTRRLDSLSGQLTTRTLVLMPIAIALNIILGQTVVAAIKLPIYLDSIGTILVAVLAGPLAGAVTGFAANILWAYVIPPPFGYPPAAAFAVVAAVIGLLAGTAARMGLLRPRTDRPLSQLALAGIGTAVVIAGLAYLASLGYTTAFGASPSLTPGANNPAFDNPIFVVLGWVALLLVALTVIGLFFVLFVRRDLTAAYCVICGAVTGIVAALVSAPIAAGVFGGVTGAGTDFLVAAFRQAGLDVGAATLGQGLISDPIDKITTFFVVYLILTAMARRTKARFPQGERLVEGADESWQGAPA